MTISPPLSAGAARAPPAPQGGGGRYKAFIHRPSVSDDRDGPDGAARGGSGEEWEKDAVLGAFCDSDSWGGGTDEGCKSALEVQAMKNVSVGLMCFLDKANISYAAPANRDAD